MPIPLGILAVAGAGAGGGGAYDLLETTLISSNTASVTFSNLGNYSAYKHLQIRVISRTTDGSSNVNLRLNGDSGSNYANHYLYGNGSSVDSGGGSSETSITIGDCSNSSQVANNFFAFYADILDFSSSVKNITTRSLSRGNAGILLRSGLWVNTNAVTSMQLYPNLGGNFVAGSRFSLYGIR